ncbi:MAG: TonB-dependent receptor [Vicinamibacterales bacterium]
MTTLRTLVAVLFVSAVASVASAQAVSGRVTDPQGGAVNGASVTLSGPGAATPASASTTADGAFAFPNVAAGLYVLSVDAPGFQKWTQAITVSSSVMPITVVLPIPGFSETVAVAAPKLEEELPQEIEKTGVRVQTITAAQLENGGYYDVSQALQSLVPGLFLAPKAGPFDYVAVALQGSRRNEILWLMDGVRISNRLYNGTTPLDTIPAHMVERVEVIEGGQGLFYGTQAVAGVINVVTKSFTEVSNGRLQGGFDSNDGKHVNLFARTTRNGNKFVVYASKDQADGFSAFPADQYAASTTDRKRGYDVATFGGKYAYDFSTALRFSGMYQRSDVEVDNLRPARSSATQVGGLNQAYNARTEHIASGKLDFSPNPGFDLFFKGYYHRWDSGYNEQRNIFAQPGTLQVISTDEFWGYRDSGVNVLARFAPDRRVEYFAGYDLQRYSGEDEVLLIAPNTEVVNAVFGQVRTTRDLMPKATFAFGARYNAPSHSKNAAVWNTSGQYDFTPALFARATVGTAFRYPDAYELFAQDPTCCFGNPNLEPEKSTNFNGSIGHRLTSGQVVLTLEATGFFRSVTNLIVDEDDGSGETTIAMNSPGKVRVKGVSLAGSGQLTPEVSASLSYTYAKSERNDLAGGYSSITGIPANQVQGMIDVHPTRAPFGVTFTVNSVGELNDSVSGFGLVASGDYTVADLSGRVFLDPKRRHRINLRLENLFDSEYATGHARGFLDNSATPFLVRNLGVPRTFHLTYAFGF